jgi:type VI secretion system protein VasG
LTQALEGAAGLCVSASQYEVTIEHLLLKLCEDPTGDVQEILRHYEIEPAEFIKALQKCTSTFRSGNPGKPVFSPRLVEMLQEAWLVSSVEFGYTQLRSGAVMLSVAMNPHRTNLEQVTDILDRIDGEDLRKKLPDAVAGSSEDIPSETAAPGGTVAPGVEGQKIHGRAADSALAKFTIDFTAEARAGKIDPIFERDREIRQMIDILARRRKNNPIIVGEAGTGKTALVEGLALRIVSGDVPDVIRGVDLLPLYMGLLQAGAGFTGSFDNRVKTVRSEDKASAKPIVLFIY